MNGSAISTILETLGLTSRVKFVPHCGGYEFTYDSNGYPATEIVVDIDDLCWVLEILGVVSNSTNTPGGGYKRFILGDCHIISNGAICTMKQTPEWFECNGSSCYEQTLPRHSAHYDTLRWKRPPLGYAGVYCEQLKKSGWEPINYIIMWNDTSKVISAELWPKYNCPPMKYKGKKFPLDVEENNTTVTYPTPAHMPRTDREVALDYIISGGATPKPGTITENTLREHLEYMAEMAKRNTITPITLPVGKYNLMVRPASLPVLKRPMGPIFDNEVE